MVHFLEIYIDNSGFSNVLNFEEKSQQTEIFCEAINIFLNISSCPVIRFLKQIFKEPTVFGSSLFWNKYFWRETNRYLYHKIWKEFLEGS